MKVPILAAVIDCVPSHLVSRGQYCRADSVLEILKLLSATDHIEHVVMQIGAKLHFLSGVEVNDSVQTETQN